MLRSRVVQTRRLTRPLALGLLLGLAVAAGAGRTFLTEGELLVLGVSLAVEPASQVVPLGVPTAVKTAMVAAGRPDLKVPLGDLPPTMRVHARLVGPGIAPLELECAPGGDLSIPALAAEGLYRVENIRLLDADRLLMQAEPASVEIRVQNILITRVESRPLTLAEIEERGIVIDASHFQVLNFTVSMALESGTVTFDVPMLLGDSQPLPLPLPRDGYPLSIGPQAERPAPRKEPEVFAVGFVPTSEKPDVERQLSVTGVLVFPQAVGFLGQFHSVVLMVTNGAPEASPLAVRDLKATFTLPSGLRRERTVPLSAAGQAVPVRHPGNDGKLGTGDDLNVIVAQASGSSELITFGEEPGVHRVDVALEGSVTGLASGKDETIRGRAAGLVVVRNPNFNLTFLVPGVVEAGRTFEFAVAMTNTSEVVANLASVRMSRSAVAGAELLTDELVVFPTIPPGESATARFEMKALRTGRVAGTRFSDPSRNLEGRFEVQLAVGDDGIPLSPEVVTFPGIAYEIGHPLVDRLLDFAATAWSNATAPAGTLPAGMPQVSTQAVRRFAAQVADAGQRLTLGESRASVLGHLWLRTAGGESGDEALDGLRRISSRWPEASAAFATALAADEAGEDPGRLASGIAATHFYLAPFALAALDADPLRLRLRLEDDYRRRLGGVEGARELPRGDRLSFEGRGELGVVADARGKFRAVVEGVLGGSGELTLVVPYLAEGEPRLCRVVLSSIDLAPGEEREVGFDSEGRECAVSTGGETVAGMPIEAPPLDLLSARVATALDPGLHVVALLFNRPVDPAAAADASAYSFLGPAMAGQRVVGSPLVQSAGRFVFLRLQNPVPPEPGSSIRLRVKAAGAGGFVSVERAIDVPEVGDGWGTVTGVALDGRGRPIAGLPVVLSENRATTYGGSFVFQPSALATTDAAGGYKFWYAKRTGRALRLSAVSAAREGAEAYATLRAPREELRLDLRFLGRGDVTGRVVDGSGQGVEQALVTGESVGAIGGQRFVQAWSTAGGPFRLEGVAVGAVNLTARTRGGEIAAKSVLVPEAGAVVDAGDLRLDTIGRATVRGRVSENGLAVPGAPVLITSYATSSPWGTWTFTDRDGLYRFAEVPAAGAQVVLEALDPADYRTVRARAARTLAAGADLAIDLFYVTGSGTVAGVVLDGWGRPAGDVVVTIAGRPDATTERDGRFAIAGVPLGSGTVVARDQSASASYTLQHDGQEAGVVLRLPAIGSVTVKVRREGQAVDRASARLLGGAGYETGMGCTTGNNHPDCTGCCRIDGVPAGEYTVAVLYQLSPSDPADGGQGRAVVRYPGDTATVEVDLPRRVVLPVSTVDEAGRPVGGATVHLLALGVSGTGRLEMVPYTEIRTDSEEGTGSFESVLEGPYSATATSPLVATTARKSGVVTGAPVELRFPLEQLVKLTVNVLSPGGEVAGDCDVDLVRLSDGVAYSHQGSPAIFEFPGGRYRLEARRVEGTRESRAFTYGDVASDQTIDLRLLGFGTVTGRVVDGLGAGVPDATVTVRSLGLAGEPDVHEGITTDADGRFSAADVREGPVTVQAESDGNFGVGSGTLADGGLVDLVVALAPTGEVAGGVTGPDGVSPAAGVPIYLKRWRSDPRPGMTGWIVVDAATSGADGRYRLGPVVYDERDGTPYRLFAFDLLTGRFASESFVLRSSSATVDLRLGARGSVEGFARDSDGLRPLPDATVELQAGSAVPEVPSLSLRTGVDAAGFYEIEGVPEGAFTAQARRRTSDLSARGEGEIRYEGDVERLDLTLEAHGTVAGVVKRDGTPVAGATVTLGRLREQTTDLEGGFQFADVPLGRFTLEATAPSSEGDRGTWTGELTRDGEVAWAEVALDGFATVEVTVTASGTYLVTVEHRGGSQEKKTDPGRHATFPNVQRGPIRVHAKLVDGPSEGVATATVVPGVEPWPVTVDVGPVGSVAGTVKDSDGSSAVRDAEVELVVTSSTAVDRYFTLTGEQGQFDFPFVRASGTIRLDVQSGDGGRARARPGWDEADDLALVLDRTPPFLVSSRPESDATGVDGRADVVLTFSEPMDAGAAASAFLFRDGAQFPGVVVSALGPTVTLTPPPGGLAGSRSHTALVRGAAEDANGQPLGSDVAVRFMTRDDIPPTAALESPLAGATNVPVATEVRLRFSEPMAVPAGDAATLSCSGPGGSFAAAAPLADDRVRAVFPAAALPADAACTVTLAALSDVAGIGVGGATSFAFQTEDTVAPRLAGVRLDPAASPYRERSPLGVQAELDGSSGDVARVDYYVNGEWRAGADAPPFAATVETPSVAEAGETFLLSAVATDDAGNRGAPVEVTLELSADAPPVVTLVEPALARYSSGAKVPIEVRASDDSGIVEVSYLVTGVAEKTKTISPGGSPRQVTLTDSVKVPVGAGEGTLLVQAQAVDRAGNTGSATRSVQIVTTGVTGIVLFPGGGFASGVVVELRNGTTVYAGTSDDNGSYTVGADAGLSYTATYHYVDPDSDRWAEQPIEDLAAGEMKTLPEITLGLTGTIAGRVTLETREGVVGVAGATVEVLTSRGTIPATYGDGGAWRAVVPELPLQVRATSPDTGFVSKTVARTPPAVDRFALTGVDVPLRTPSITGVSPSAGPLTPTVVTVSGNYFHQDLTVTLEGGRIGDPSVSPPERIQLTLSADLSGPATIAVTNPDGGFGEATYTFNPDDLGTVALQRSHDLRSAGGTVYVATDSGLLALRLRPAPEEGFDKSGPSGATAYGRLAVTGDWAFASDYSYPSDRVHLFDVRDRQAAPILVDASLRSLGYPVADLVARGPLEAWALTGNRLVRLRVADPDGSPHLEVVEPPVYLGLSASRARLVGSRLYVASAGNDLPGGIRVFDVSDPERPALLGERLGTYGALAVAGTTVVAARWDSPYRLEVLDATWPHAIGLVGSIGWAAQVEDIVLSDEKAYVCDRSRFVRAIAVGPEPRVVEEIDLGSGTLERVLVDGTLLYAAAGSAGVRAFEPRQQALAPRLEAVDRAASLPAGGSRFIVAGYDLAHDSSVTVGANPAVDVFVGEDWLEATAPAGTEGTPAAVAVSSGPSGVNDELEGAFEYTEEPRLFSFAPATDSPFGGMPIRLDGINLEGATVRFGEDALVVVGGRVAAPAGTPGDVLEVRLDGRPPIHQTFRTTEHKLDLERTGPLSPGYSLLQVAASARLDGSFLVAAYDNQGYVNLLGIDDDRVQLHGRYQKSTDCPPQLVGSLLYLSSGPTVQIVDVSDPSRPIARSKIVDPVLAAGAGEIVVAGTRLYTQTSGCVFDVSDPDVPVRLGCLGSNLGGSFVVSGAEAIHRSGSSLRIVDFARPATPGVTILPSCDGYPALSGTRGFLGNSATVCTLDREPDPPVVRSLERPGVSLQPDRPLVIGDQVFFRASGGGFQALTDSLVDPQPTRRIPEPAQVQAAVAAGGWIFAARTGGRLLVYDTAATSGTPEVTSISPASGSEGTRVTILGRRFSDRASIHFGDVNAASVVVFDSGRIEAVAPEGAGEVEVKVKNPDGEPAIAADRFQYVTPVPVVTAVLPGHGPIDGGTTIRLRGSGLAGVTEVVVSQTGTGGSAVEPTPGEPGEIVFTLPAAPAGIPGPATIALRTLDQELPQVAAFRYVPEERARHGFGSGPIVVCDGSLYHSAWSPAGYQTRRFDLAAPDGVAAELSPVFPVQACAGGLVVAGPKAYRPDGTVEPEWPNVQFDQVAAFDDRFYGLTVGSPGQLRAYDADTLSSVGSPLSLSCSYHPTYTYFAAASRDRVAVRCAGVLHLIDVVNDEMQVVSSVLLPTGDLVFDGATAYYRGGRYDLTGNLGEPRQLADPTARTGTWALTPERLYAGGNGIIEVWRRAADGGLTFEDWIPAPVTFTRFLVHDDLLILDNGPTVLKLTGETDEQERLRVVSVWPAERYAGGEQDQDVVIRGAHLDRTTSISFADQEVDADIDVDFRVLSPDEVLVMMPPRGATGTVAIEVVGPAPDEKGRVDFSYEGEQRARYLWPTKGAAGSRFSVGLEICAQDTPTVALDRVDVQAEAVTLAPGGCRIDVVVPDLAPGVKATSVTVDDVPVLLPKDFEVQQ